MFNYINPTFPLFGLNISWYAVCILIGVIIAVYLGLREARKIGISSDSIYIGLAIILPSAIIGARLWYVIFNADDFKSFSEIIGFRNGEFIGLAGLAIQGGVLVTCVLAPIYCKVRKISIYRILDLIAPGLFIGQICGRWGNFFNRELYGPSVSSEWYQNVLKIFGDQMYINGAYRHPVFLYEGLLNLVCLIFMLVIRRKDKKYLHSGDMIGIYLTWYGCVRIFTESLRLKSGVAEPLMAGPIPVSILISVIFIIVGISFLVLKRVLGGKEIKGKIIFPEEIKYADLLEEIKNNRFDTILFDLDGTLLNSQEWITKSFEHTFQKFRPDAEISEEEYVSFFGPTLYQTFSKYSDNEEEINEMIAYYRAYNVEGYDENVRLFPGAKETLKILHRKGYKLGIVSSKKKDLVEHTIELFGLTEYIDIIIGHGDFEKPKPDPESLLMAMKKLESKNTLYVGDTLSDMKAAKAANAKACGVLYSASIEELLDEKPDYVIKNMSQLTEVCGE